jgi:hypothetical protein
MKEIQLHYPNKEFYNWWNFTILSKQWNLKIKGIQLNCLVFKIPWNSRIPHPKNEILEN